MSGLDAFLKPRGSGKATPAEEVNAQVAALPKASEELATMGPHAGDVHDDGQAAVAAAASVTASPPEPARSALSALDLVSKRFWFPEDEPQDEATKALSGFVGFQGAVRPPKDPRKGKTKFVVLRTLYIDGADSFLDEIEFGTEGEALGWAYSEKEFADFCSDKALWFDGRRYLWRFRIEDGLFRIGERYVPTFDDAEGP